MATHCNVGRLELVWASVSQHQIQVEIGWLPPHDWPFEEVSKTNNTGAPCSPEAVLEVAASKHGALYYLCVFVQHVDGVALGRVLPLNRPRARTEAHSEDLKPPNPLQPFANEFGSNSEPPFTGGRSPIDSSPVSEGMVAAKLPSSVQLDDLAMLAVLAVERDMCVECFPETL